MDGVSAFLELLADRGYAAGRLRGVFHILIGRRITAPDGTVVSVGLTWRQLAAVLKASKFDKKLVHELGADPDRLAPRDRERMWYAAIGLAKVNSPEAHQQAVELIALLEPLGYQIGPPPSEPTRESTPPPPAPPTEPKKKRKKS